MTIQQDCPVTAADPFGPHVLENPLPFQETLREAGPVVRLSAYGVYGLGRYADVHAALTNWQHYQSAAGVGLSNFRVEKPWRPPSLLLESDPPHHDAPRQVLEPILTPRALRALRPVWAEAAEQLVENVVQAGTVDLVPAIAQAFPLKVFPDAVGLGKIGRENLLPYGDHAFNAFGPPNELVQKGLPLIAGISDWVNAQCVREALEPGGFGAQIWEAADRGDITPQQAPLIVRSLLTAGVDTTVHSLAATLYAFARHPQEWDRLRAEPALARVAFDEAVRWESPVQTFFRTVTADVQIGDVIIPAGEKILMFLGAANRDPRRWADPHHFDLSRDPSGHVGFGMGIHQCVGQHVARLEAEVVLTSLAARVRRIELTAEPVRHLNNTLRAFESMPARLVTSR